jgi:hypothetical protein
MDHAVNFLSKRSEEMCAYRLKHPDFCRRMREKDREYKQRRRADPEFLARMRKSKRDYEARQRAARKAARG